MRKASLKVLCLSLMLMLCSCGVSGNTGQEDSAQNGNNVTSAVVSDTAPTNTNVGSDSTGSHLDAPGEKDSLAETGGEVLEITTSQRSDQGSDKQSDTITSAVTTEDNSTTTISPENGNSDKPDITPTETATEAATVTPTPAPTECPSATPTDNPVVTPTDNSTPTPVAPTEAPTTSPTPKPDGNLTEDDGGAIQLPIAP